MRRSSSGALLSVRVPNRDRHDHSEQLNESKCRIMRPSQLEMPQVRDGERTET